MSEPYLICHVVRGQPAFDIAIQLEGAGTPSDPGPWWIVPTSGHRARPYWQVPLSKLVMKSESQGTFDSDPYIEIMPTLPTEGLASWPDHYSGTTVTVRVGPKAKVIDLDDLEIET